MLLLLAQLQMMKIRVGDGWTVVCSKKRKNLKNLKEKKDFWEGGLFNRSKEKGGSKKNESKKEEGVFKPGSLRSDSKTENFQEAPFFSLRCSGPIPDSGIPVVAGVFDVPSHADLPAAVLGTSGTALPKVKLEPEVVVAGTQVEQEERVTGDTPPARLGCCPGVENDLLRASRVKFDTLSSGAATRLRMQTKPTSGCAAGSRCGSAGDPGRGDLDLGVGGVSYVELLILFELWAGERLSLEKAHPRYLRPGRPISVSAVPFGPGIDIWRSCRFVGALMRSLCLLLSGLRRFVPCSIGADHCRLRHIGWEKCGHGLTSRPRESASELFLNELLSLFRYHPKSGRALLAGTLPLRFCAARFACRTPTWRLPVPGHVAGLVTACSGVVPEVLARGEGHGVPWVHGSGPGRKRFRLNRKTPAHLVVPMVQSRPRIWKRLRHVGFSGISMPDHTRRRCDHAYGGTVPAHDRIGVG